MEFIKGNTWSETLGPGMKITDQVTADRYFEELVGLVMKDEGLSRAEAEANCRHNLGYFAGYCDSVTRERVERLFKCVHPGFDRFSKNGPPSAADAFEAGRNMARAKEMAKP